MKKISNGLLAVLLSGLCPVVAAAQIGTATPPKYNRLSVGVQATHLYDLRYESYDDLQNGFSGEDMQGLNGGKSRFDMAYGLNVAYQFSPILAVDLYGMLGSMSGANQIEYYQSNIRVMGLGANVALKTAKTSQYRLVPYLRFATGWSAYDATRYFILDDVDFSSEKGSTWHYNLGIGANVHLNNQWSMFAQSVFNVVATDAWDGYNYGAGKDHMVKTTLGVRFTFGNKSRPNLNRAEAWQGQTDPELLASQERLNDGLRAVNEKVFDLETSQAAQKNRLEAAIQELKNETNPDSLLALIDRRISQYQAELKSGEVSAIYFDFNRAEVKAAGQMVIADVAKLMKSNPNWKVSVSAFNDPVGNDQANQEIRNARREAVKKALVAQGIAANRIEFKEWQGVYTGNDQIDRRAELRIMK
jgi:outer membrane protein OmpA-like peptidoglycan-associated protein